MPRLSQNSLHKRFFCPHCRKSMRTRQGLSGHIQFKHDASRKSAEAGFGELTSKMRVYDIAASSAGVPDSERKARLLMLLKWIKIQTFCEIMGLEVSSQDFKNYIITSLTLERTEET